MRLKTHFKLSLLLLLLEPVVVVVDVDVDVDVGGKLNVSTEMFPSQKPTCCVTTR